jgi:hypothetical protein
MEAIPPPYSERLAIMIKVAIIKMTPRSVIKGGGVVSQFLYVEGSISIFSAFNRVEFVLVF